MKLAELQEVLRAADPAAVLVSPRVMERVIQEVCGLPGLGWTVPHAKSIVVDRQLLFRHVDQDELALESDQLLPQQVILLARPPAEEISAREPEPLLLEYWQRLFHAKVHQALERAEQDGALIDADIRGRIEQVGQAEFEEVRVVLQNEAYLLPGVSPTQIYVEFAAVFLELAFFAPKLLPVYFPGLRDLDTILLLLDKDVNAEELFQQTRLRGAPDPVVRGETTSQEAHEYYWRLVNRSERMAQQGNLVRAAILCRKAARVAPAALSFGTRSDAVQHLKQLVDRLQAALQLSDGEVAEWMKDLPNLLDQADQGTNPVEALLLDDLQKVCIDHERDIFALDMVEWFMTGGRRPIVRPLPSQRLVRLIGHLRSVQVRVSQTRLPDADRQHFSALIERALHGSEERIRAGFRPVLNTALHDVGLHPENPLERTAFSKVVENILDRIIEYGYLTFGDLRDCISSNQLKLRDLGNPHEFIKGDPLLRLDKRLASLLDGVYRPSEFYLRVIERFTALNFGTWLGRQITKFVTIPFGGAFLVLEGIIYLIHALNKPAVPVEQTTPPPPIMSNSLYYSLLIVLGMIFLAFLHREEWRRVLTHIGVGFWTGVRRLFFDWPVAVVRIPAFRRFLSSWPIQLFYWYLAKPTVVCVLIWLAFPEAFHHPLAAPAIFVAVHLALNSRPGHAASELFIQSLIAFFRLLRQGLISGLIFLVVRILKQITDTVELILFRVQEWLRFRSGESKASIVIRALLGLLWFPIAYLARFYIVVLIEPCLHPLKLPISMLATKFMLPIMPLLWNATFPYLTPYLGEWLAGFFVSVQLFFLPDAFGFIFWEMKGNWSLYKANRSATLKPLAIGAHGETMRRLLQPGFHSGTVPNLFARLRKAELFALKSGNGSAARANHRELEKVEQSLRQFIAREMIHLLNQSRNWQSAGLHVGRVALATNRITAELGLDAYADHPVRLEFEACRGWLVAGLRERGWLDRLPLEQTRAFNTALAILYKLAGVDLVREQLRTTLPPLITTYDITSNGLQLWRDRSQGHTLAINLREPEERPVLEIDESLGTSWPLVDYQRLLFKDVNLTWQQCVESWQMDRDGHGHPNLVVGGTEVSLLGERPAAEPPDKEPPDTRIAKVVCPSLPNGVAP